LIPIQRYQRLLIWYIDFFEISCACRLGMLVAWHLVGKRGIKVDPWKGGGLGFNSGWWGIDTMMYR
jgi:hypothetical protein